MPEDACEGFVVCEDFVDLRGGVVGVAGVIDPRAFDHEEEAFFGGFGGVGECVEREFGHFVEGGVVCVLTVEVVGDVFVREETEESRKGSTGRRTMEG